MSADQNIGEGRSFLETCVELSLLTEIEAESLLQSGDVAVDLAHEAVKQGLLTPADVDIVQSLQSPTLAVPGYAIESMIGRGGMGVVYRAKQLDLDRVVALKTILINNVSNPTIAARFEREAKALARLQHPNIVQALNFGKHQGRYFFAMEFVPGRTCEQAIRDDGVMPAENVWLLVRQTASGLLHALNQNLIHRDIKPANLILVPPPEGSRWAGAVEIVKITDFGLAMFADVGDDKLKLTTGDKIMGSPAYMSPEQFGVGEVDFRTDMYALGATAWHLLFGTLPFQGGIAQLYHQKTKPLEVDPTTLPVTIPASHWQLLKALLDPDPDRRPASYESLIETIDGLGLSDPIAGWNSPTPAPHDSSTQTPPDEQVTLAPVAPRIVTEAPPPDTNSDRTQQAMAPTMVLPGPSPQSQTTSRMVWVVVAILGLCLILLVSLWPGSPTRGAREFTRVASSFPLFDGVTLSGWDVGGSMVGPWNTVEAPDASTALACTTGQGALTRRIPELEHPRITLFAWLTATGAEVDVDFAFDPAAPAESRGCLHLSESGIQLGLKNSDFGAIDPVAEVDAPSTLFDRYHVIHLERQQDDWFVFLEEKLIGTLPISSTGGGSTLRLVVYGSDQTDQQETQAYFADLQVSDLRAKESNPL